MKGALKLLFGFIMVFMLVLTSWASYRCPLFGIPRPVATHPWFLATTADAYFAFITFSVWTSYKQTRWSAKVSWFLAAVLLGNLATAAYCLSELIVEPKDASIGELLVRKRAGPGALGIVLAAIGIAVTVLGAVTA